MESVNQLSEISRPLPIPHDGIVSDILWSDPDDIPNEWGPNGRGPGLLFGVKAVDRFLHANGIGIISRAHQLVMEGYQYLFDEKVVTVWSAPNYCYRCGNMASFMMVGKDGNRKFVTFDKAEDQIRKPELDKQ